MSKYVEQYRKLEEHADALEQRAEDYKSRAEEDRWEQCRIAYEAVESGDFSRRSFADAVGKGKSTIGRQYQMWDAHGGVPREDRPSYTDAHNEVLDRPGGREGTIHRVKGGVRNLPPEDKRQTFKELAEDPDVADDIATRAAAAQSLQKATDRQQRKTEREDDSRSRGLRATTEFMQAHAAIVDIEDKAARVGRIWREHSASWTEEERQNFRDAWAEAVEQVSYTTDSLTKEEGWDDALASLVNQEG